MANSDLVQSLLRGLDLVEMLADHPEGMYLNDLAARAGLKKPTAHNLLRTLVSRGFAARDEAGRYTAGPALAAEEGLLLGNGDLSCSIYQTADEVVFRFGKGDVWDRRLDLDGLPPPTTLKEFRRGMIDAASAHGTARRIGLPSLRIAAKTGTAEFDARDGLEHQHAWIIAYEPWDEPERAYAILAEDSDAGGTTAAYILRDILQALLRVNALCAWGCP